MRHGLVPSINTLFSKQSHCINCGGIRPFYFLLNGTAVISDEEIKGERYRIFHQASTGFSGTSGIRRSATKRANGFCREKASHKKMLTVSEHTAAPPYILGNFPRIEIIFVCVDKKVRLPAAGTL